MQHDLPHAVEHFVAGLKMGRATFDFHPNHREIRRLAVCAGTVAVLGKGWIDSDFRETCLKDAKIYLA